MDGQRILVGGGQILTKNLSLPMDGANFSSNFFLQKVGEGKFFHTRFGQIFRHDLGVVCTTTRG